MRIATLIAATLSALAFATPSFGAEPAGLGKFNGSSWLELRTYLAGEGLVSPPSQAVSSLRSSKDSIEIVPLPIDRDAVAGSGILSAAMQAYQKALKPLRADIAQDALITGALKAKGLDINDVLAVSRGSEAVTVFVEDAA